MPQFLSNVYVALKSQHAILGLFNFGKFNSADSQSFTMVERSLFLSMAVTAAWPGVFLKYFYLPTWVPSFFDPVTDGLNIFPDTWLHDAIDSGICAVIGANVDMFLGREAVRAVLKKDWESRSGARAFASYAASSYAILLSAGCFGHLCYTLVVSKPSMSLQLVGKYFTTVMIKMTFVETAMIAAKTYMACWKEERARDKDKKA